MHREECNFLHQLDGRSYIFPTKLFGDSFGDWNCEVINCEDEIKYNICAVVHHYPPQSNRRNAQIDDGYRGHYTAAVKVDNKWIMVDDSELSEVDEEQAMNKQTATILFYQKI